MDEMRKEFESWAAEFGVACEYEDFAWAVWQAAAEDEREACAKLCDSLSTGFHSPHEYSDDCADAIRSRTVVDKQEFINGYAKRSNVSVEKLLTYYVCLPCECGEKSCNGLAIVRNNPDSIQTHMELYGPNAATTPTTAPPDSAR